MKKYIFINYYSDKNLERKKEYLYCVQKNVEPEFIDKIFIFVEDPNAKKDIPYNDKIVFIDIPKRMEFKDAMEYAAKNLEDDSIVIILNLDIFIDNSKEWANIDKEFFDIGFDKKAMVLCRHNLISYTQYEIEKHSWITGHFCDGWVFKTPFNKKFLKEDLNFALGTYNCDNLMMHLMSKHHHTYSWGSKYKIYHLDLARKLNTNDKNKLSNQDNRASERKEEHNNISALQDWDFLLKSKTPPEYRKTWIKCYENNRIFYATFP
jgi:hypothetical protein